MAGNIQFKLLEANKALTLKTILNISFVLDIANELYPFLILVYEYKLRLFPIISPIYQKLKN